MGLLEEYIQQCEEIAFFEERLKSVESEGLNEHSIEAEKEELQNLWAEWKISYRKCISDPDSAKSDKATAKSKKSGAHNAYIRCVTIIGQWKDNLKIKSPPNNRNVTTSISVPPCDTQVFYGDYVSWPSFRDLFTAIYINNKKLSSVEKLYHLFQKTDGEAREINRNIPLTSEGFEIAWSNLKNQYENKRILINNQLRTLFSLPQCTQESASSLKKLQREITNCMSVLKLYKIDIGSWDPIFVFQCSSKLPKLTLSPWEQSIANKTELPKWEDLDRFLTERFQALESVSDIIGSNDSVPRQKYNNNSDKSKHYKVHHTKVNSIKCNLCKGPHKLQSCPKFLNMEFKNRISVVRRDKHCLKCLGLGHMAADCQGKSACVKCGANHHTLLHKEKSVGKEAEAVTSESPCSTHPLNTHSADQPSTSQNIQSYHTSVSNKTMLATAWVTITKYSLSQRVRALIDPCSDDTFISSRIQKMLKLPTKPISADISGLGGEHLTKCSKIALFTLCSAKNGFSAEVEALVVPDVTGNVPTHSFPNVGREDIRKLEFADPEFYKSAPVDILIGGNLYPMILLKGVEHGILGSLVAQETVFGWIVTGPSNNCTPKRLVRLSHCTRVSINEQMAKFWEIEEIPNRVTASEEDTICEEIYRSTTVRDSNGRYIVDLPFKSDSPPNLKLGQSRYIALSQFLRNEKSLSQKIDLRNMYDDVIKEYLYLGHMKSVQPPKDSSESGFYLPHHGVFKPDSATTKLRVVFNASCTSSNGKSLNDCLYTGPVLQKDIVSLILNWRLYKIVFNADISKMYRQILVNPNHAPFQRIMYRTSPEEEMQEFQLTTVTFGVNCAPYLALRTLLKLAEDEEHRFPVGAKILRESMYVDDALVGVHSIPDGLEARNELTEILKSGGFHLRKWTSNCKEILQNLPREYLLNEEFLNFDDKSNAKTLGIRWNATVFIS
ncbi:uncharacterized protein LOC142239810 [Haematobia irritans]|uniref:uncharacterized protein LOC142239810 n=1 Tax=Haematobia irritans TaxID=7368 RepID=UPI003F508398